MTSSPDRYARLLALALFLGFIGLYALTWNGRYLHDGPLFIKYVNTDTWLHVHVAYLPFAHMLRLALGWIPGVDGTTCLALLAVLSGAAMTTCTYLLCTRLTGDIGIGTTVAVLVGISPVVWSAAGMVEIHVFGGAGACAAAWLAYRPQGRPALRAALATAVALCAHMTNIVILPLIVLLSTAIGRRKSFSRELGLALVAAAGVAIAMRSLGQALPPKVSSLASVLPTLYEQMLNHLGRPSHFLSRLQEEYVRPWLILSLGPLLALLPQGKVLFRIRACSAALGIALAPLLATYIPMAGQYGLVLCPILVIGVAHSLSALRPGRLRSLLFTALIAGSLLLALPERKRLIADPDKDWAEAVSSYLGSTDVVMCFGLSRKMRIEELTEATAVDFMHSGDSGSVGADDVVLQAVQKVAGSGRELYLDPQVFSLGPQFPTLRPILSSIRATLAIDHVEGYPVYRVSLRMKH